MREILEDAAITYRQEAENFLLVAAPAIVLGPVLVLMSAAGLKAALISIPLLLMLYVAVYAASVRAAGLVLSNAEPEPAASYLGVLWKAHSVIRAAIPGALLAALAWGAYLGIQHFGQPIVVAAAGIGGATALFFWAAHHVYDLPLILCHGVGTADAGRIGRGLAARQPDPAPALLLLVSTPLLLAVLLTPLLGALVRPAFGSVVFAAAFGLWLPYCALCLASSCDRLVREAAAADSGRRTRIAG
ncbi:MAG: hypothetical protein IIC89_04120 [Chloroflexi bacterium]|nr:hypothetical protein [Chloroflexota bacterium]MCI0850147.1 hypothetical protein [Chloroflexota bacterium]